MKGLNFKSGSVVFYVTASLFSRFCKYLMIGATLEQFFALPQKKAKQNKKARWVADILNKGFS